LRDVRVRYQQTALGVVWVILQPLVPAVIFAAVFGSFARLPSGGQPYVLFAMSGFVIWNFISGAISRSAASLLTDSRLISRVYFPRLVLPAAAGSAAVVDLAIAMIVLAIAILVSGHAIAVQIVLVPVVALWGLAFALGFGSAVAALSAYYRDFAYTLPFLLQVLLFASPVAYSIELVPVSFRGLYALNPVVGITESFRWAVLGGSFATDLVLPGVVTTGIAAAVGGWIFSRVERGLADVI
jgi:lipopolysaccharide transport system permease protein